MSNLRRLLRFGAALALSASALSAAAQTLDRESILINPDAVPTMRVYPDGRSFMFQPNGDVHPVGCQEVSSHTDADFTGGTYVIQAGFAEQEWAAASYVLPANKFPLRIDLIEMIFAQSNAVVTTTTHWSVAVWDGTPATGTKIAEYSSDGLLLPHIVMPPGTNGVNVAFGIDPSDPEQIIVYNNSGTNTFSVGFRIDKHNNQTQNPCFTAPPSNSNAFPCTDVSGLASAMHNWLYGVNCGTFGCPPNGGWARFSQMPSYCVPSGDWVLRASWTPLTCTDGAGACCKPNGTCEFTTQANCQSQGGSYQGDGSNCAGVQCPQPTGACCFQTGGCLNLTATNCAGAGGTWLGAGTACATGNTCPTGACCLPDGSCVGGVTASACSQLNGTFQGSGTQCGTTNCPPPVGACCIGSGFCLSLTQQDCAIIPGVWAGPLTNCADGNGNGTPDACESPACLGDADGDGQINQSDLALLLATYNRCQGDSGYDDRADFDSDNCVGQSDLAVLLAVYNQQCP